MLVPTITSTGTRSSSSTFSTPTCAAPRAPPPDSTRPIFGRAAWLAPPGRSATTVEAVCATADSEAAKSSAAEQARGTRSEGEQQHSSVLVAGSAARLGR